MKNMHIFFWLPLVLFAWLLSSCVFSETLPPETEIVTTESELTGAETTPTDRYTVVFDESEPFPTEAARKASQRIDPAIRTAVKLLNTVDMEPLPILDGDHDARPKRRDTLSNPLSKEVYDEIRTKVSAFEEYRFCEEDFPGEDLFSIFVSAIDALRIDHTELFLCCDAKFSGTDYLSGYFLPGTWPTVPCDDVDVLRAEAALCDAVVDRILDKMPDGLSNFEKCCYFAFVLSASNTYDYSDTIPLYDYHAYDAFVKGTTICSGYAQAFDRLCREAGISSWFCKGNTPAGRHAWNMLDTEAGPIYIDVTWYDTEEIQDDYRDGKEEYLFMRPEDFDYHGYVQDSQQ